MRPPTPGMVRVACVYTPAPAPARPDFSRLHPVPACARHGTGPRHHKQCGQKPHVRLVGSWRRGDLSTGMTRVGWTAGNLHPGLWCGRAQGAASLCPDPSPVFLVEWPFLVISSCPPPPPTHRPTEPRQPRSVTLADLTLLFEKSSQRGPSPARRAASLPGPPPAPALSAGLSPPGSRPARAGRGTAAGIPPLRFLLLLWPLCGL